MMLQSAKWRTFITFFSGRWRRAFKNTTINQRPNQRTNETLVRIDDDDDDHHHGLNLFDFWEEMRLLGTAMTYQFFLRSVHRSLFPTPSITWKVLRTVCTQLLFRISRRIFCSSVALLNGDVVIVRKKIHNYINLLPWCAMDHVQWSARRHQTSHSRRRRRRRRRKR
jgi:hypothetical protein